MAAGAFAAAVRAAVGQDSPEGGLSEAKRVGLRRRALDWLRARKRVTAVGDLDVDVEPPEAVADRGYVSPWIDRPADAHAEAHDEDRLITAAFAKLPSRWREVLWQLEVEGKTPAAVAPMFGLSANGVSALAVRAREGLRQAYLQQHVGANMQDACRSYAAEFGAGARGKLSNRRRAAMQEHLGQCSRCHDLFSELTELNSRLGSILTPAALAAAGAALRHGRHGAVARTALASHVKNWRWHPVTSAAGAAAGVVAAGGMLFAVNITPAPGAPAHSTVQASVPGSASSGGSQGHRRPREKHYGGQGREASGDRRATGS